MNTTSSTATPTPLNTGIPKVVWGQDMLSGEIRPYYEGEPPPLLQPLQPPTAPVVVQRDVWPFRLLAGGAAASMVLGTVGAVAPQLVMAGHAVEMAGFGVGAALAGLALVKGNAPKIAVSVAATITGATATSTSSSSSRSASGWKPTT